MVNQDLDWHPIGWWRVLSPEGSIWCETSIEKEARERMRPGDRLQKFYKAELFEWRDEE